MKQKDGGTSLNIAPARQNRRRPTFASLLESDPLLTTNTNETGSPYNNYYAYSNTPPTPITGDASPSNNYMIMSPAAWSQASPFIKSPWQLIPRLSDSSNSSLIGTIVREEGHVYSLAASKDGLLYTGSDSKNIHVWKNLKEFTGFKSNSGLVKAIVTFGDRIFTGHQDGKIRVWRVSSRNPGVYRRIGSLPTLKEYIKMAMNAKNFVQIRRHHNSLRIKHFDAVSCLSLDTEEGLLYSGSWDKSLKVWRVQDYKCLESIEAHDDAINSVAVGFDGLVFTGSADGTVKAWRKEMKGRKQTKHVLAHTLLKQDKAVTAVVVQNGSNDSSVVYSGSSDGMVNFWERETALSHGGILHGHTLAVLCLASAGCLVFSGSADKTICVWRRDVGGIHTCLSVLTGHEAPIKCLAVEQDNNIREEEEEELSDYDIPPRRHHPANWVLYSGSLDKSVKVWSVSENQSLEENY